MTVHFRKRQGRRPYTSERGKEDDRTLQERQEEDLNLYEEAERRLYHTGRGREEDRILHEEEEEGKSQKL